MGECLERHFAIYLFFALIWKFLTKCGFLQIMVDFEYDFVYFHENIAS